MSFRGKLWVMVLSGAISVYAVIGGLPFVGAVLTTQAQQPTNDPGSQLRIVESVLQHIQNDYVDTPDMDKVRVGALRGLASGLDPYTSYLTPEQVKEYQSGGAAKKSGIGAEFSQVAGYVYVIAVTKGGPAEKAGLKAGDVIEYVDTKATRDISLYDARQAISGDAGSVVSLRVLRSGEKPQTIKVTRGAVKTPVAESRIEAGKIGVIKVNSLDSGEANDIREQVASLVKQGAVKVILDLRGVAGGTIDEGVAVANIFIREGEIAKVIGREGKVTKTFTADPSKAAFDGEMVVLIDLGTAGAAEVVAAAVLERKRGEVIGERSFGAGTEQQLFPMSTGAGYLLTVAKWAAPSGTPFFGEERTAMGVKPSIEVKRPDTPEPLAVEDMLDQQERQATDPAATPTPTPKPKAVVTEDIQLKKAIEVLSGKAEPAKAA
ncbi:MAG: PDZ domain-containing protein [Pyrinomonadaceae bacterium]|nr:PDZ domain-containing protein [Pyrinomonadaceae bacterium]MBP6213933.1 PDZ domain-containing protein [Pyrinomonadaceae bacterium]